VRAPRGLRCGDDPVIRFWWTFCEPCQQPARWTGPPPSHGGDGKDARGKGGEWWAPLKQVDSPARGGEVLHAPRTACTCPSAIL
jgi:hypothetical protein